MATMPRLFTAARRDDAATLKKLLIETTPTPDIDKMVDEEGYTLLLAAASEGAVHSIALLLDLGAWVGCMHSKSGKSPLVIAIESGSPEAARALVAGGADLLSRPPRQKVLHTIACPATAVAADVAAARSYVPTALKRALIADVDVFDMDAPHSDALARNLALKFKSGPGAGLALAVSTISTCRHEAARRRRYGIAGEAGVARLADQAEVMIVSLLEALDEGEASDVLRSAAGSRAMLRAVHVGARRLMACEGVQAYIRNLWYGPHMRGFVLYSRQRLDSPQDIVLRHVLLLFLWIPLNLLLLVPLALCPPLDAPLGRWLGGRLLLQNPWFKYMTLAVSPVVLGFLFIAQEGPLASEGGALTM